MRWSRIMLAVTVLAVSWPHTAGAQNKPPAPARRRRSGSRSESQPARLHDRQPADDAAPAEVQERVPRHAPLRTAARRRRLRRPGRRFVRPRLRGADRSRVPLRHHARRAGRHPPDQQQDDRVLRQYSVLQQRENRMHRARRASRASTARTTSRTATRRRWASSSRVSSARYGAIYARADVGEQLEPAAERADRRQRHVHPGPGRAPAHPADRLSRRRVHPAGRLRAGRRTTARSASRSAPAATCSSSISRTASARRWASSRAAAPAATTGISASTSRGSSSNDHDIDSQRRLRSSSRAVRVCLRWQRQSRNRTRPAGGRRRWWRNRRHRGGHDHDHRGWRVAVERDGHRRAHASRSSTTTPDRTTWRRIRIREHTDCPEINSGIPAGRPERHDAESQHRAHVRLPRSQSAGRTSLQGTIRIQ